MTETTAENSKKHVDSERTVAVLGMHRSGTSAVAGLLAKMGLSFGAESALLPASSDNPKGYFEHRTLVAANQVLLVGQRASWLQVQDYGTPGFDCATVAASVQASFEGLAVDLLDSIDAHGPRAIKDPRLCLTLPCWRQLLPDLVCIHVTRNPLAVARSLERRADMPVPVGIALWELYSRRVLTYTRGIPTFRVRFEDFIRDPVRISRDIRDFLLDAGVSGVSIAAVEAATEAVDAALVHQVGTDAPLDQLLSAPQLALFSYLENDDRQAAENAGQLSTGAEMILAAHEQSLTELHRLMALGPGETCAELKRSLRQAEADRDELMRLCESFRTSARAAFESLSWRSGTVLKRLVLTATRREEGPTAEKHVRKLSSQFDHWKRQFASRALGGPSAASLAALWMRLNGHKQVMIAALLDEDALHEKDNLIARRVALPLALSRVDVSVLPVLPDDLPRSPADLILAQFGVCHDVSQARIISARARAMNVPIVCIVAGSTGTQGHVGREAAEPGALRPADIILADAAKAIVAFDDAAADRLRREGYGARVMPSEHSVSAEADRMTSFSPDDAAFWQEMLVALSPPPPAGCRTPSFDWSRLPLLHPGHFDAAAYLSQNPEISAAVADGRLASALGHWQARRYRGC
ncbi:MAG: sulfotransferase, partial [Thiohalocapsa sp.]|nr:sulfotransferase [Thiohalocapsa sp.]